MEKRRITLDLDRQLLDQAAAALGTTRSVDTVRAALTEVVMRRRRRALVDRDYAELGVLLPQLRTSRGAEIVGRLGQSRQDVRMTTEEIMALTRGDD